MLFGCFYFQGVKKFFKFGLSLEVARSIIYNYPKILRNPLNIFNVFFKRLNWNLVTFLAGYVGIYRVNKSKKNLTIVLITVVLTKFIIFTLQFVNCWLNRRNIYLNEEVSKRNNQLASLLCGLVFYLYPDQAIFSHTAVTIIEIYWTLYYDRIKAFLKWIPLDKIKMLHIVFPIVFGYMCHIRAFTPWLAPAMLKKLMHFSTNYK